tara:strand:+ start:463 stop:1809 length:1347 start_codon:yes stop_codon:yes gene_type:complete
MIDPRTGYVSREWYRWFYSLYNVVGAGTGIIPISGGGTGISTIPTDGQLLIGNGTGYSLNTLTGGQNIGVLNGAGTIAVGLTGEVPVVNGGTGADNATDARANLEAAKSGDNSDITSLSGITGSIATPTYIDFNTTPTFTDQMARLGWNATDKTLNLGMDYGVVQQIGLESYARVQNNTGVTIPNGTVVGFAGVGAGATLSVTPFNADGSTPTLYILGIMTHDLPDTGEIGYCSVWGYVREVDTSAFALGDVLFADPATPGGLTATKPTSPDAVVPVAAVLAVDAINGVIFVRPTIEQQKYFGVFSKTTDQTPVVIDTAYAITFDSTRIANGVAIGATTSHIEVIESGLYDVACTLQYTSTSAAAKTIYSWIRKNGTDVADSSRLLTLTGNNQYNPVSISEAVSLSAGDYIEIMFAADSTAVTLDAVAATAFSPAAPAANLVIQQVQL